MTICISAIGSDESNGDEFIVFSTDHMVTFGNDQVSNEFEHNIKKYKEIGLQKNTVAMLSGETLRFEELLEDTDELENYDQIKNKIHENFQKIKKKQIKNQLLDPFSIKEEDLKEFLSKPLDNQVTKSILESIIKHKIEAQILLIGFKEDNAQVHEINENECISVRDLNFHTIGSGGLQATNTLFVQKHSKKNDLKKTIYNVYKAKRNAEAAKGVGKDTEILICNKDKISSLGQNDLEKLQKIYEKELDYGKEKIKEEDLNSVNHLLNYSERGE